MKLANPLAKTFKWIWRNVGTPIGQFVAWWFGMFALLGPLSTCPICGQSGCGGGMASAGILGALAAAALWLPRRIVKIFRRRLVAREGNSE